jgi:hypothetical protein
MLILGCAKQDVLGVPKEKRRAEKGAELAAKRPSRIRKVAENGDKQETVEQRVPDVNRDRYVGPSAIHSYWTADLFVLPFG